MSQDRYDVVFYGEILDGFDLQSVKQGFINLFSLTEEKVEQIFASSKVTIKPGLDQQTADKYQRALEKVGALTVIESQAIAEEDSLSEAVTQGTTEDTAEDTTEDEVAAADSADMTAVAEASEDIREIPFQFSGNGKEYFKIWIVNIFLTIVTLGIYSAWAKVRNKQYFYGNTQLDGASFEYLANPVKILQGRIIAFIFLVLYSASGQISVVAGMVMGLLLLVLLPWLVVRSLAFNARNSAYRNIRFNFTGKIGEAVKVFIGWPLLVPFTLGLLAPYAFYRQKRFVVENSSYGTSQFSFDAEAKDFYMLFLMVLAIAIGGGVAAAVLGALTPALAALGSIIVYLAIFAYFAVKQANIIYNASGIRTHGFHCFYEVKSYALLLLTNTLGIILTLGLFIPWAKVRSARYKAEHLTFIADGDLNSFVAEEAEHVSALGEEIGEIFAFDIGL